MQISRKLTLIENRSTISVLSRDLIISRLFQPVKYLSLHSSHNCPGNPPFLRLMIAGLLVSALIVIEL